MTWLLRRHGLLASMQAWAATAVLLMVVTVSQAWAAPPFSWARVPVAADLRTQAAMTDEEARFIASHFSFVALEKGQGLESLPPGNKYTEEGFVQARRALKAANPNLPVLFYWNSAIFYPLYRANNEFQMEAWCRRRGGPRNPDPECMRDVRDRNQYDRRNPGFQDWWHRTAMSAVRDLRADGVFVDAIGREFDPGLAQMLGRLTGALQPTGDKLVLINLAQGLERSSAEYLNLPGVDGFMIEHFGVRERSSAESMKSDMLAVQEMGKRGKVVLFKGWPEFVRRDERWFHQTRQQRPPYQQLVEQARREIVFPLACFLAVAQPYSYFQYSWGYAEPSDGNLIYRADGRVDPKWYPELLRSLGAPRGDAIVQGYRFRRSFAHAEVDVDLVSRVATIRWADGQTSASAPVAGAGMEPVPRRVAPPREPVYSR